MSESVVLRDPVEELAEEFMARLRRGERPNVSEYAAVHPGLASEILDLFPALIVMEEVKSAGTEPHAGCRETETIPKQLGDYRIIREVARGGMGVVYEAEQLALGRHVALKVLPAQLGSDTLPLMRFRREARSAARLHHTNIVPVFDVGTAEGVHYYAMQFIQGQGLDEVLRELQRLRSGTSSTVAKAADFTVSLAHGLQTGDFPTTPIPERAAHRPEPSAVISGLVSHYFRSVARLGTQAAEALAYAHSQRVLHRDVKPSNLLLDHHGTLWLTDFGLAKDDSDGLTRMGDVVGTLRYMAPERFEGVSDPGSDVYSLGVTLYELLTLRPAFDIADRVLLIRQIAQAEPPRPRSIDPTIPRDLETIVLKAIEKCPTRRYHAAADMADDLRRFLSDRPIKARRATWREQTWRWCRRNPGLAASLSAVFTLLFVLVVGLSVGSVIVWRAKREAERNLVEAGRSLYFQRVALADRDFQANNVPRAESLLALCPEQLRGWEWHYLNRNRGRPPKPLTFPGAVTGLGALSPDGLRAAAAGTHGLVYVLDLQTGQASKFQAYAADSRECLVEFTPNGQFLVTADEPAAGNTTVKLWDATTLRQVASDWVYPFGGIFPFAISADSQRLITSNALQGIEEFRIDIWDLATGQHQTEVEGRHTENPQQLAFSPDGRLVASASGDGTIRVSDSHTGKIHKLFTHDPQMGYQFWALAFSPDGRRVAAGYGQESQKTSGGVFLWDVASGQQSGTPAGHEVFGLAFGPGGRMVTCGVDGMVRVWDAESWQELLSFRGHTDVARCLGFTPDGHKLVTIGLDRIVGVWDGSPVQEGEHLGDELRNVCEAKNGLYAARYLPGDRELVTVGVEGTVRRFPLAPSAAGAGSVVATGTDVSVAVGRNALAIADNGGRVYRLVDTATGGTLKTIDGPRDGDNARALEFSPDGDLLAGCGFGSNAVVVWDLQSCRQRELPGHNYYIYALAFRPGIANNLLATVSTAGEVFVWDPKTEKLPLAQHQHPSACTVAFSPNGHRMATGGWDRVVRLWDTSDDDPQKWSVIDSWPDPTGGPNAVAFSPDGTLLAWGGTDSMIKVWKIGTREVVTLRGHRHWVWDVNFNADGSEMISASRDGTVKLWSNPFWNR